MTHSLLSYPEPAIDAAPDHSQGAIETERQWRCPDIHDTRLSRERRDMLVSRWTRNDATPLEVVNQGSDAYHCIAVNLKCTSLTFVLASRTLVHGRLTPGAVQITVPDAACSAVFQSPSDVIHLFVSQPVLADCYEDIFDRPHAGDIRIDNPKLVRDAALDRLGQVFAVSQVNDDPLGKVFAESVSLAIVSRVVARHFTSAKRNTREVAALPQWRLSRAIDYIDAHLAQAIALSDIAASVGLTRMHFAAQFRRATGMRPHEYVLRRRIERAQHLLLSSRHNVLDVAFNCGFRSQSHFTTVFKRFVGATPYLWRMKANVNQQTVS